MVVSTSAPADRIRDPPIDIGFPPSRPVHADLDLSREGAFGDLAVDGRAGQAGPREDGPEANDTIRFRHGRLAFAGSIWHVLEPDRAIQGLRAIQLSSHRPVSWKRRQIGGLTVQYHAPCRCRG